MKQYKKQRDLAGRKKEQFKRRTFTFEFKTEVIRHT